MPVSSSNGPFVPRKSFPKSTKESARLGFLRSLSARSRDKFRYRKCTETFQQLSNYRLTSGNQQSSDYYTNVLPPRKVFEHKLGSV